MCMGMVPVVFKCYLRDECSDMYIIQVEASGLLSGTCKSADHWTIILSSVHFL